MKLDMRITQIIVKKRSKDKAYRLSDNPLIRISTPLEKVEYLNILTNRSTINILSILILES